MDREFKFEADSILYHGPSKIEAQVTYDILSKKIGENVVTTEGCSGILLRVKIDEDSIKYPVTYTVTVTLYIDMNVHPEPYVPREEEIHA